MALTSLDARRVLDVVWRELFNASPTLAEIQATQAIARFEGGYGSGKYVDKVHGTTVTDSNNWGAMHVPLPGGKPPCDPAISFEATDHFKGKPFQVCFQKFATPEDGARAYLRELLVKRPSVRAVIGSGDADAISAAMARTTYHGTSVEIYADAIARNAADVARLLGERLAVFRQPATGPAALGWLALLGLALGGAYLASRSRALRASSGRA